MAVALEAAACTSAVVSAARSATSHAMLWKHRDTGVRHNFIARREATDSTMAFVALFNQGDVALSEAWVGVNSAGFAIMNTATYNMAPDTALVKDREGLVMAEALGRCVTVDDFEALLERLPRPAGIQANFGVIDARGGVAYFEAWDHGFRRYEYADSVGVRANYCHSGGEKRLGLQREITAVNTVNARQLIKPELFTDTLSRRLWDNRAGCDMLDTGLSTVADKGDFIPRATSTASVVIETGPRREDVRLHVILGYPPCGVTRTFGFDDIPSELTPGADGVAPDDAEASRRRDAIYHGTKDIDLKQFPRL